MNRLAAALYLCTLACGRGPNPLTAAAPEPAPTPFAVQFTGVYTGPGALSRLELEPDGSYELQLGSAVVRGLYQADAALLSRSRSSSTP